MPTSRYTWNTRNTADFIGYPEQFVRFLCRSGLMPFIEVHEKCWRFDPVLVKAAAEKLGLIKNDPDSNGNTQQA